MTSESKDINQELEDLSSSLAGLEKRDPGLPPDGYFSQMQEAVMRSVHSEKMEATTQSKVVGLGLYSWVGRIAAGLILLLGIGWGIWINTESPQKNYLAQLSDEELYDYVMEHASDYDLVSDLNEVDIVTEVGMESMDEDEIYDELLYDMELNEFL